MAVNFCILKLRMAIWGMWLNLKIVKAIELLYINQLNQIDELNTTLPYQT